MSALKAPFPYFGGKSRVAALVWQRLGDVANYIEPFSGTAAVLLARPHPPRIETVNDSNAYLANFWRATREAPDLVAEHADWPVNESDLHARHRWLVLSAEAAEFRRRMRSDPEYFDPKIAGWWCWGACCWIGSGWCADSELRADGSPREKMPKPSPDSGGVCQVLHAKRPFLGSPDSDGSGGSSPGRGVHAKGPKPSAEWEQTPRALGGRNGPPGVLAGPSDTHRPQLADQYARGRGVHGNDAAGTCADRRAWLLDWFGRLRDRLRTVRVCCGDWRRVCDSPSVTTRLGTTGIFLDAPYKTRLADGTANRSADLYANDGAQDVNALVDDVIAYCVERGADPLMRLGACCYEGEGYEVLADLGWECVPWKAQGGYGNRSAVGRENAARERIWFSPGCVKPGNGQPRFLFD